MFKAIACFREAVALDATYAQAWAGLADGHTITAQSGFKPGVEALPEALHAARQALRLDPDLAEAHSALACATMIHDRDDELAETREFRRALELNARYPQGRAWYGLWYLQWVAGRVEEGRAELARMVEDGMRCRRMRTLASVSPTLRVADRSKPWNMRSAASSSTRSHTSGIGFIRSRSIMLVDMPRPWQPGNTR